jgi:hypothetical protein
MMGRKIICQFSSELTGMIKGVKVTKIHPAGTPAIVSVEGKGISAHTLGVVGYLIFDFLCDFHAGLPFSVRG